MSSKQKVYKNKRWRRKKQKLIEPASIMSIYLGLFLDYMVLIGHNIRVFKLQLRYPISESEDYIEPSTSS